MLNKGYRGIKTGITSEAGPCVCTYYSMDNIKIITILLCSKSQDERWVEV